MEARYPEINLGATICEKIKIIYQNDVHWSDCHKEVAQKFTLLKEIMRKFFPDKSDLDILKVLQKFSVEDIKDAFTTEGVCKADQRDPF